MAIAFNNQNNSIGIGSTNSSGFTSSITINSTGVGIGTTNPTQSLDIQGNVKATTFYGSASGLTDIPVAYGKVLAATYGMLMP